MRWPNYDLDCLFRQRCDWSVDLVGHASCLYAFVLVILHGTAESGCPTEEPMMNGQLGEASGGRSGGTFAGKTIIVTGGSRGIGRAIALRLAREGGKLVLAARDAVSLPKVVAETEKDGGGGPS